MFGACPDPVVGAAQMVVAGADEGFMPASAPITALQNDYYATEEEFITAYGDAMREEYQAILDAGLILQIDCRCW